MSPVLTVVVVVLGALGAGLTAGVGLGLLLRRAFPGPPPKDADGSAEPAP